MKTISVIAVFYLVQTLVGGIAFQAVPAWLRSQRVELDIIGLVSLAMIPWSLRVFWASGIERLRVTPLGRVRTKGLLIYGQITMALILIGLAMTNPGMTVVLISLVIFISFVSCCVEVACDAYMIENLKPSAYGIGNGLRVGCGYLGMAIGGGGLIYLFDQWGWETAMLTYSALLILLVLPLWFAPGVTQVSVTDDKTYQRPSLLKTLRRPRVIKIIVLVFFFEISCRLVSSMLSPFAIDAGISLSSLGTVIGLGGGICGIAGTITGMGLIRMFSYRWALLFATVIKCLSIASLVFLSSRGKVSHDELIYAYLFFGFTFAVGLVCLYSFITTQVRLQQAGLDFTLFQCGSALAAGCAGFLGGFIAHYAGYTILFSLSLFCAAIVLIILFRSPVLKSTAVLD